MSFHLTQAKREEHLVDILHDDQGNGLEIWPGGGFNAYRWHVEHGGRQELLYASPALFQEMRPTRSGIPVLFPFPNRIRDARFSWEGKAYQLPITDSNGKNSIHGFVCRLPWRVVDRGADPSHAWITGEFQGSKDAPESLAAWPSDYLLRMTYRFLGLRLRLDIEVENRGATSLPFGLGFHPYFSLSGFGREEAVVGVPAAQVWPLLDNLPAGPPKPVGGMRDLRHGQVCGALRLDDVLTDLQGATRNAEGLVRFGWIEDWQQRRRLDLFASEEFREVVVFNPPHREAFCIEPYTCVTDAVNLKGQGYDTGWRALPAGGRWTAALEFVFEPLA